MQYNQGKGTWGISLFVVGLYKLSIHFGRTVHLIVRLTDPPVCQPTTPGCHSHVLALVNGSIFFTAPKHFARFCDCQYGDVMLDFQFSVKLLK